MVHCYRVETHHRVRQDDAWLDWLGWVGSSCSTSSSALIWRQLVRSRWRPAHLARGACDQATPPWAQDSLTRTPSTPCAPFLCVAGRGFSHIRLHRPGKGRPDSLVNPILLRQPWHACRVGGTQCVSFDPTLLHQLSCSGCLAGLPTKFPARPAREAAGGTSRLPESLCPATFLFPGTALAYAPGSLASSFLSPMAPATLPTITDDLFLLVSEMMWLFLPRI